MAYNLRPHKAINYKALLPRRNKVIRSLRYLPQAHEMMMRHGLDALIEAVNVMPRKEADSRLHTLAMELADSIGVPQEFRCEDWMFGVRGITDLSYKNTDGTKGVIIRVSAVERWILQLAMALIDRADGE